MRGLPERIQLKTPDQIALMRAAGLVVAQALAAALVDGLPVHGAAGVRRPQVASGATRPPVSR